MIGLIVLGILVALILLIVFLPAVGLTILGLILLIIILLITVPIGAEIGYIDGDVRLAAKADGFTIQLLPKKPGKQTKPKKEKKPKPEKKQKKEPPPEEKPKPKKKLDFTGDEILELIKKVLSGTKKFGKLTVHRFMLHYVAAGNDPYKTAMTFNYVNAALSSLAPICAERFIVKETDVWTDVDFTTDKTKIDAELSVTLRLAQVFHMVFAIAFGALGVLIKNKIRLFKEKRANLKNKDDEAQIDSDTNNIETEQNIKAEERTDSNG